MSRYPADLFTPLTEDLTVRLRFDGADVEVLSGDPSQRGPGESCRVMIGGHVFRVLGQPCSLDCFCDASLELVVDLTASQPDLEHHVHVYQDGTRAHRYRALTERAREDLAPYRRYQESHLKDYVGFESPHVHDLVEITVPDPFPNDED